MQPHAIRCRHGLRLQVLVVLPRQTLSFGSGRRAWFVFFSVAAASGGTRVVARWGKARWKGVVGRTEPEPRYLVTVNKEMENR